MNETIFWSVFAALCAWSVIAVVAKLILTAIGILE